MRIPVRYAPIVFWPIACPTVTLLAPWVRRLVGRVTA